MNIARTCLAFVALVSLCLVLPAQQPASKISTKTVTCSLQDGKQVSITFPLDLEPNKDALDSNDVWAPGGSPLALSTQVPLHAGGNLIPAGKYSLYFVPGGSSWTLIVNKNVQAGTSYDSQQDLVHINMGAGKVASSHPLNVALYMAAPGECDLRVGYGKDESWTAFKEK
jgi:hypothetical protein